MIVFYRYSVIAFGGLLSLATPAFAQNVQSGDVVHTTAQNEITTNHSATPSPTSITVSSSQTAIDARMEHKREAERYALEKAGTSYLSVEQRIGYFREFELKQAQSVRKQGKSSR